MKKWIAALLACVALAGCAAIPTNGPVRPGDTAVAETEPLEPLLQGPDPGASPREIVRGFLAASAGGSVSDFDTAREFLTADAAAHWDPLATTTIYDSREVEPSFDERTGTYTYRVPVAAVVDASGVMVEASDDVHADITFTVTTDEFGRNRISELADGIVMPSANFERFFRPLRLYFATPDGTMLVPEVRWFADNDQMIATAVSRELVKGPSAWLADAVVTGFPPGSALDVDSVVVSDGVAAVSLAAGSAGDESQRALALEQLRLTLTQLPAVQDVDATVGGVPLGRDGSVELVAAPLPPEEAAVIADGRLGLVTGTSVSVTPESTGVVPEGASGLALSYDGTTVAMVVGGSVVTSTALGDAPGLEPFNAETESLAEPVTIPTVPALAGEHLVAPSYDAHGWLWSTERASQGVVLAGLGGGAPVALDAPWLAGRSVQAIAVSRDGTRLAILSRATGDVQSLEVAAIVRDAEGVPLALGQPLAASPSAAASTDVEWADDVSLLALASESGNIDQAVVGGWTTREATRADTIHIAARNGARTLLAVDASGNLVARAGNGWSTPLASRIADVAYAG